MRRHPAVSSLVLLLTSSAAFLAAGCGGDSLTPSAPAQRSDLVPPIEQQDVVYPLPPAFDYCGGTSASQVLEVKTDAAAGFAWSSSVFVPASGGQVKVYFANLGPGPLTFPAGSWSVNGDPIPFGTPTEIPMTPTGSSLTFWDGFWSGTFPAGYGWFGCLYLSDIEFKSPKHKHATAHVDLSFVRDGVTHTFRVNIHTGTVAP